MDKTDNYNYSCRCMHAMTERTMYLKVWLLRGLFV